MLNRLMIVAGIVMFAAGSPAVAQPANAKERADITALIDRLAEVNDSDLVEGHGSSPLSFAPLDARNSLGWSHRLEEPRPSGGDTIRHLVRHGVKALPLLLAHLDDDRPTKIQFGECGPFCAYLFEDIADRNPRAHGPAPVRNADERKNEGDDSRTYSVKVGDLCCVAIGQIVNRMYFVVTGRGKFSLVLTSPTRSKYMRRCVRSQWESLTPAQHQAALIVDARKPDFPDRRIGACQRLAYYYPDAIEPLALGILAEPTYDRVAAYHFVRDKMLDVDPEVAKDRLREFVKQHGEPAREGVHRALFGALNVSENAQSARTLLHHLYNHKADVAPTDKPFFVSSSDDERSMWIGQALIYDQSPKIDKAVLGLLIAAQSDFDCECCLHRLIGRGYDDEIERQCRRRIKPQKGRYDDEFRQILGKIGWTLLHVAAERGDIDAVIRFKPTRDTINAKDRNGRTALHVATAEGHLDVVRLLVASKAALDAKTVDGLTPAQVAVRADHYEIVQFLVQSGCSIPDLLVAAVAGRADLVKALSATDAARKVWTGNSESPLRLATYFDHVKTVEELLVRGSNVESTKDEHYPTPLHLAVWLGRDDILRVLLKYKANVRARTGELQELEPIHLAVRAGQENAVAMLLDGGAPIDARMTHFWGNATPLHLAVEKGQLKMVDLLLKRGAKPDERDNNGETALHWAARYDRAEIAKRLIQAKADVNAKQHLGNVPLHIAVDEGHIDMVRVLVDGKADRSAKDGGGKTPLERARENGDKKMIDLLTRSPGS